MQLPTGLPKSNTGSTNTDDGSVVSVVFDAMCADSQLSDQTQSAEATVLNFEVPLVANPYGLVRIEARGFMATVGEHSWTQAVIWVNGQRMSPRSNPSEFNENFYAAMCVDTRDKSALRVSVTLLAQRDLAVSSSSAQVTLDTLDFSVLNERRP